MKRISLAMTDVGHARLVELMAAHKRGQIEVVEGLLLGTPDDQAGDVIAAGIKVREPEEKATRKEVMDKIKDMNPEELKKLLALVGNTSQ